MKERGGKTKTKRKKGVTQAIVSVRAKYFVLCLS